ncbi:hypothetical protein MNBD_GAMMA09-1145 [hydrothermal vent metagenome]|uniref:CENP-V/GFA domain-containing protein n=1 Tax=hydrothermal vent metagenome TaxID=652676 RepID=A0A3B0Y5R4_9ZZZZ
MHTGSCECKTIQYKLTAEPLTCYACHCTDCQTSSGSAFGLSMLVNEADITVTEGEPGVSIRAINDITVKHHHCTDCGTAFWISADAYPGILALKPGTFDDTSWYSPVAHLWVRSAQPWMSLDPAIKQFEKQPEFSELIDLWSASKSTRKTD